MKTLERLTATVLTTLLVLLICLPFLVTPAPIKIAVAPQPQPTVQVATDVASACVLIEATSAMGLGWYGCGFVASEDGLIVTAGHVVEGASSFKITFEDDRVFESTTAYRVPDMDCGVIKISTDDLPYLTIRPEPVVMGEMVTTMGHPFGLDYGLSVSRGIVSGVNRSISFFGTIGLIQTDMEVNGGNSGGPLLDIDGNVVGIVVGHRPYANSLTFATPARICKLAVDAFRVEQLFKAERHE